MNVRKKSSSRPALAKKAAIRSVKKAVTAKEPARSAGKRISTRDAEREAMSHVISRPYLSPLGKGEISVRRITAAIKAVKKAQGYNFRDLAAVSPKPRLHLRVRASSLAKTSSNAIDLAVPAFNC